jgi:uncharacterized membrane protein YedE/YeeE
MVLVVNFLLGALFSIGLSISGMVNPNKVIGFLDIFGEWDPALAFVMAGGVLLNVVLFKFILKRKNPILSPNFVVPLNSKVDKRLVVGSAMFGIGWGLGGICPGPGLANLFLFDPKAILFVISMLVGMVIFGKLNRV